MDKEVVFGPQSWGITDNNLIIPVDGLHHEVTASNEISESLPESINNSNTSIGQTLLIGIDKSFFDSSSKDVIFVQNADIKLSGTELSFENSTCTSASKYISPGYLISLVEPTKTNNWQNIHLRRVRKERSDLHNEITASPVGAVLVRSSNKITACTAIDNENIDNNTSHEVPTSPVEISVADQSGREQNLNNVVTGVVVVPPTSMMSENCLPLKKKSKMKKVDGLRQCVGLGSNNENESAAMNGVKGPNDSPGKTSICPPLAIRKRAKRQKRSCCYSDSDQSDGETTPLPLFENCAAVNSYNAISDVIDDLKSRELVDDEFGHLILKGVSELRTDVLEELKSGFDNSSVSTPSYQLLAFAFLLYFRKRLAYHYMAAVFSTTWPSVDKLKEWKKLVNSTIKDRKRKND